MHAAHVLLCLFQVAHRACLLLNMAAAGPRFPHTGVELIGRYLPGLIIRPFGEAEIVTPHVNAAYCLLQRGAVQAFLALDRALVLPPAPFQQPADVHWFPVNLDMCFYLLATTRLPEDPMLDYPMLKHPILKILPERPQDLVQLCPHPLRAQQPRVEDIALQCFLASWSRAANGHSP